MFNNILNELMPIYKHKNIATNLDIEFTKLSGNMALLYTAFFNIVENAFKYTNENGYIEILATVNNNIKTIHIQNTGIYIDDDDDINNIFDPFYRADKSRSKKIPGSGLGLSIAKDIFNKHNAEILVKSTRDESTIFSIYFKYNDKI